ncbi:MAG: CarD family transcriptional regulator [Bacillota bacterium]
MKFKVGDRVVYPSHGSGTIKSIENRTVLGTKCPYLEVTLKASDMRVMIPVDEAETVGLRKVVDRDTINECLDMLRSRQTKMSSNWNRRFRANTEKIKTGDIFEVAEVVRNLTARDEDRGLATSERKMLDETREILCSEIALALDIDLEEANRIIDEVLSNNPHISDSE